MLVPATRTPSTVLHTRASFSPRAPPQRTKWSNTRLVKLAQVHNSLPPSLSLTRALSLARSLFLALSRSLARSFALFLSLALSLSRFFSLSLSLVRALALSSLAWGGREQVSSARQETTRGEKSAYFECWILKFVLVTRTFGHDPQFTVES